MYVEIHWWLSWTLTLALSLSPSLYICLYKYIFVFCLSVCFSSFQQCPKCVIDNLARWYFQDCTLHNAYNFSNETYHHRPTYTYSSSLLIVEKHNFCDHITDERLHIYHTGLRLLALPFCSFNFSNRELLEKWLAGNDSPF